METRRILLCERRMARLRYDMLKKNGRLTMTDSEDRNIKVKWSMIYERAQRRELRHQPSEGSSYPGVKYRFHDIQSQSMLTAGQEMLGLKWI